MDFATYQTKSNVTWKSINRQTDELHALIGLSGEVGELHEKVKKLHRDAFPQVSDLTAIRGIIASSSGDLGAEIGDILYYLARVCDIYGLNLQECAEGNIEKIMSRKERGVLSGSGDNR